MPRISEERRRQRREQILTAARDLFIDKGFHATSMDDIIAAAQTSAGGVYRYFTGKDAIITAIAEQTVGQLAARIRTILDVDPLPPLAQALAAVVTAVDELAELSGGLALQVWGEAQRDPVIAALAATELSVVREAMAELVARARDAGQLPADLDPAGAAQVLFALAPGYLVQKRLLGDVDPQSFVAALAPLLPAPAAAADRPPDRSGDPTPRHERPGQAAWPSSSTAAT